MKNRFVPFSLITAFFVLALLSFSVLSLAGQPGKTNPQKPDGSWKETVCANQHTGVVNPLDVIKARQQAEEMAFKSSAEGLGLYGVSLGPNNYAGMSWSAIFDNTDPTGSTLISGAANGGLWKSTNLGLSWTSLPVAENRVPKISSIVQASSGTIYAATGVSTCKTIKYAGDGIYRSASGSEFARIPATVGNADFDAVAKLAINSQTDRIFAATFGGIYYSDNGNDWTKVIPGYAMDVCVGPDGTVIMSVGDSAYLAPAGDLNSLITLTTGKENSLPSGGIGWMVFAIAPSDANVMYASMANTDGKLLNIYTSIDKGTTWTIAFPSNPSYEPFSGYGCYANTLAVFPNDPGKVFLGGRNMWYGRKEVATGFYNWEQVSFGTYGAYSPYFAPLYHHSYCFRPNNANQLVMATDGGVSLATIGTSDFTFQTSNKNLQTTQFNTVGFSAQKDYVMGGGTRIGTLVLGYFHPSEVSFASDGYQAWRIDAASLGVNAQPQPSNYGGNGGTCAWSNMISDIAVYSKTGLSKIRRQNFTDINYYNNFAMGIKTDTTGHVPMRLWESFNQGQVFGITRDSVKYYAAFDTIPADTTVMVASSSNGFLFPYYITSPLPKGDSITVADPIASRFFVYGDSLLLKGIFMTKDLLKFQNDPEYFMIFKNLAANDPVTAMAVSEDLTTLWAGTSKGRLIRITGLLNAYDSATANITSSQCVLVDTAFANTPFTGRYVTSVSINPHNANLVLVTLGNYGNQDYVYYSQNGNAASPVFTAAQGSGLPAVPVYSGLLEMSADGRAVLGTDVGVYSTSNLNAGATVWAMDMQNIGNVAVTEIKQQVLEDYHILNYGVIYLSTYGRGLWMDTTYYSPLGIGPVQGGVDNHYRLDLNPNPVKDIVQISYSNETRGNVIISVYDMTGRELIHKILGNQPEGKVKTSLDLSGFASGTYVVKVGNGYGKIVKL